ncbi:MAG TPA: S8 family serine peptidase [Thermoanaerobaculia bacterium]|nr:S8 family serine peptidase [Thermoanaerobaculia bacterium]
MYRSVTTINADNARKVFGATGQDIVWAVLDSGIDAGHIHFRKHENLDLRSPLSHRDFTADGPGEPLHDAHGNGTANASIIAGEVTEQDLEIVVKARGRDAANEKTTDLLRPHAIAGMAPQAKLLSMKVLDEKGNGKTSTILEALQEIQEINGYGRMIRVHGVNLSLGFEFDSEQFACGLSPLCVEVERLVRSGVVVVVAAGNTGFGYQQSLTGTSRMGMAMSINDPGNAEMAITVGATHRDMPQVYGVSYFSAKGPTLDGRLKPDLLAPGERIAVAAAGRAADADTKGVAQYVEDSGTGQAAAHVSGAIAAFLSVRRELIGKPEEVKKIFLDTAVDLGRTPFHQGRGLINLLHALEHAARATPQPIKPGRPGSAASEPRESSKQPLRLMCSYSHKDEVLWDELKAHLAPLRRQGLIEIWHDRRIIAGEEWSEEIASSLEQADIILLLVSAYFVDSDYCYGIEMKRALERHEAGEARVIPVVVRPTDWSETPFAKLQALPRDGKAVTGWGDQHEAWTDVAKGVRRAVEQKNR